MDNKNYGEMPEVPEIDDYNDRRCEKAYKGCFWSMVLALATFLIVSVILLTSCTTTKVVEVEKVRTDTTYITKWQRDSVWLHDSIMVTDKGDTIRIERWHTKYVEKQVHDTTYVATHDTIPQPYPVETVKVVEKELNWWQRLRLWIGNVGLMALLGFVGYWGVRCYKVYKYRL
jgi:hypothetical protein